MREELLHRFWNPKFTGRWKFETTDLKPIFIRNFGELNTLQGPDFKGAEVEIESLVFCGAIEMHIKSSDWFKHGHQFDPRYNQVILHVVWQMDKDVVNQKGNKVPTLCLSDYFNEKDLQKVQSESSNDAVYPCRLDFSTIPTNLIDEQLYQASLREITLQSEETFQWAEKLNFDWEKVLFVRLLSYSVDPQNRQIAYDLANQIPLKVFRRYPFKDYIGWVLMESGIWEQTPEKIRHLYKAFTDSYRCNVFPKIVPLQNWQHRNIRPGAYPIQRIVQFLYWVATRQGYLDSLLKEQQNSYLDYLIVSREHENSSDKLATIESISSLNSNIRARLIQNAIIPTWGARRIFFGKEIDSELLSFNFFAAFEKNRITSAMKWMFPCKNKFNQSNSYALLAQNKHFCKLKNCSSCCIGKELWFG